MKNENRVSNSDYLRNLLETLEQSLVSNAQSLDNIAISLENAYFASREPEVLEVKETARLLIDRLRLSSG